MSENTTSRLDLYAELIPVLTDNLISSLATLLPLEQLVNLRHLSLRGNPVTEHEHYKEFVVWKVGGVLRSFPGFPFSCPPRVA